MGTHSKYIELNELLDAVYWMYKAYFETNTSSIIRCFTHAGFPMEALEENVTKLEDTEDPDGDLQIAHFKESD